MEDDLEQKEDRERKSEKASEESRDTKHSLSLINPFLYAYAMQFLASLKFDISLVVSLGDISSQISVS